MRTTLLVPIVLAALWLFPSTGSAQSSCSDISFTSPAGSPVTVGTQPGAVAFGDFDRDGNPDMATANRTANTVSILLGDVAGGFTEATGSPVTVGTTPSSIAVGDFDRDGTLDMAVANSNFAASSVSILIGDGDGGFTQPGAAISTGTSPFFVTTADLNGDGALDLVTANFGGGNVTVLLGNGSGGFSPAIGSPVTVGMAPTSIAVADFDHNGRLDMAVVNSMSDRVSILLGNGAGGFTLAGTPIYSGMLPVTAAAGDFDRDGDIDLAIGNNSGNNVTILLGNGDGGFTAATGSPFSIGGTARWIVAGDYNADGLLDLATVTGSGNSVAILLGNGDGSFSTAASSPVSTGAGTNPQFIATADIDRDGRLDLATTNWNNASATILLNRCSAGAGCTAPGYDAASGSPIDVAANPIWIVTEDANVDGRLDLMVMHRDDDIVTTLLGDGDGGFSEASGSPSTVDGTATEHFVTGDFNRDGVPDLATANSQSKDVSILLGDGSGAFAHATGSPISLGSYEPQTITSGDFNRDGKLDLVTANRRQHTLTILLGDGSGGFSQSSVSVGDGTFPWIAAAADFDGDGALDLATTNIGTNTVSIFLGDGAGGFALTGTPIAVAGLPIFATAGDIDRDGRADLVVAQFIDNKVAVLLGDGAGGFTEAAGSPIAVGFNPFQIVIRDLNRDNKPDLAVVNSLGNDATLLHGDGNGGFTEAAGSPVEPGDQSNSVAVGDFDRDGVLDLAMPFADDELGISNVAILLASCGTQPSTTAPTVTGQPSTQTICTGYTASFTSLANGTPTPTVQWQKSTDDGTSWNDVAGATSTTHDFTAAHADNGSGYRAVFTSSAGSVTSDVATLTVNPPPTMTFSLSPAAITSPTAAMSTITASISISGGCSTQVQLQSITATENGSSISIASDVANASLASDDRSFDLRAKTTTAGVGRAYAITYRLIDGEFQRDYQQFVVALPAGSSLAPSGTGKLVINAPQPNPLTTSSNLGLITTTTCFVKVSVYTLAGVWLTDITTSQSVNGGYSLAWNGNNAAGQPVPNGLYILQAKGCSEKATTVISIQRP